MLLAHTQGMLGKDELLDILNNRKWLRGAYLHAWTTMIGKPIGLCAVSELRKHLRHSEVQQAAVRHIAKFYMGETDFITLDADARDHANGGRTIAVERWDDSFTCINTDVTANSWSTDRIHKHNGTTMWHGLVIPLAASILSTALEMVTDGDLNPAQDACNAAEALAAHLNAKYLPHPVAPAAASYSDAPKAPTISFDHYTTEETTMSAIQAQVLTRRAVRVRIIDNDPALLIEHSFVAESEVTMTEDNDAITIQQFLADFPINEAVAQHNETRATLTDEEILKRTGQDVKLRPIRLKDLTITVVAA